MLGRKLDGNQIAREYRTCAGHADLLLRDGGKRQAGKCDCLLEFTSRPELALGAARESGHNSICQNGLKVLLRATVSPQKRDSSAISSGVAALKSAESTPFADTRWRNRLANRDQTGGTTEATGLDEATHSPVPSIGWGHPLSRIGWVHPVSGTKETWMAPFVLWTWLQPDDQSCRSEVAKGASWRASSLRCWQYSCMHAAGLPVRDCEPNPVLEGINREMLEGDATMRLARYLTGWLRAHL